MHGIVANETRELSVDQKQRDVFEAHRHRVFSVSYYMTSNEVEAEAILTRTFVQAFSVEETPDARKVDEALLAELERRFSLSPAAPAKATPGASIAQGQVRKTDLEEAVAMLPPQERLIFLLRDVEGYRPDRVADLLQCAELDVQTTLISARIRMRNALQQLRAREQMAAPNQAALNRLAPNQELVADVADCA